MQTPQSMCYLATDQLSVVDILNMEERVLEERSLQKGSSDLVLWRGSDFSSKNGLNPKRRPRFSDYFLVAG